MNQSIQSGNKSNHYLGRYSSTSTDDNSHSLSNGMGLSLQAFVDDIPFEFNPKYRTIFVPNIDIPEYDTTKIRDIISKPIDFTLENKVLLEALEDLQRKKKEIEADTLLQPAPLPTATVTTNCSTANSVPLVSNKLSDNVQFSVTHPPPPLTHLPAVQPSMHLPMSNTIFPVTPVPAPRQPPPPPPIPSKQNVSPSYHLPTVRDIYWPTGNQQQYTVPISGPPISSNTLSLPTPIHSTNSSPNSVREPSRSFNNCDSIVANDLAATFDGTLGSDDPFHDAELKSLNDVAELRHLYSAIGSANTVRR